MLHMSNDSFDKVKCCFDFAAIFGNKVERCFDIVDGVDGPLEIRHSLNNSVKHVVFLIIYGVQNTE